MKPIRPYSVSPIRPVPKSIPRPPYIGAPGPEVYHGSDVQTQETIERMRLAGRIAAQAIQVTAAAIAPGVTTDQLDALAHEFICDQGAYPSTLGYRGFPKSICSSVNEVVCHGIPDARPLEDGDLVKIDITVFKDGVHGDNCATFGCGALDQASADLMVHTEEAMNRAIRAVKPGRQLNIVGRVVEAYAGRFGYGVVRDYTGHGVHTAFHSGLIVLHHDEPALTRLIEPGMTFTIEPMLTLGDYHCHQWDDGWTVVTNDGSRAAQFEQTLVVTADGAEILTRAD
ncbi:MAG: type I methionyl aminopeptidase [Propionibacteriaceae bacterium]|nr:type I methionyl aminopeptidase [Propionibacteriaceae bacterium]